MNNMHLCGADVALVPLIHCGLVMPDGVINLMEPSHYLNQYGLTINEVVCQSPKDNIKGFAADINNLSTHTCMLKISNLVHIDGLIQDCSISSVLAMEILQSCTKLLI